MQTSKWREAKLLFYEKIFTFRSMILLTENGVTPESPRNNWICWKFRNIVRSIRNSICKLSRYVPVANGLSPTFIEHIACNLFFCYFAIFTLWIESPSPLLNIVDAVWRQHLWNIFAYVCPPLSDFLFWFVGYMFRTYLTECFFAAILHLNMKCVVILNSKY